MHPNGQGPHLLVVNHAPEILDLMRDLLEEEGYRVTTQAREGQSIDRIAELAPDAIVLDYMWPGSDDEWVLLNLLRIDRRTRAIPVVLCTAAVRQVRDMQEHLDSIGVRVVYKPFDIDHLIRVVSDALSPAPSTEDVPPGPVR